MAEKMSDKCKKIAPTTDIDKLLYENFTSEFRYGYIEIGEEKMVMPMIYKDIADEIENFEVRDTDIFIASHPKTGTTWSQEMMWLIVNNLDYEGAKVSIDKRFPYLEIQCIYDYSKILTKYPDFKPIPEVYDSIDIVKKCQEVPRLIKTHLPWCLLPKALRAGTTKAKVVYVARNAKDTCVSFYHHGRNIEGYSGTLDVFCKLFLAGRLNYGPFWKNILGFWERRGDPNILFIKYEDMKNDLRSVINVVSDFLIGKRFEDSQISKLVEHLSFDSMKMNKSVNFEHSLKKNYRFLKNPEKDGKFMRCGTVGSYKAEMSMEMEEMFNKWIEENTKGTDIEL